MKYILISLAFMLLLNVGCVKKKEKVDLIIYNAKVYTVDSAFTNAEAFAVKDGHFIMVGKTSEVSEKYYAENAIDLHGKVVYPGLIDAHCHFFGYGSYKNTVNLSGVVSEEEMISKVVDFADNNNTAWIRGRGWDQNLWEGNEFPTFNKLNELFPDRPILLIRVDGHAVLVNQAAMDLVNPPLEDIQEYMVLKDGNFAGVLLDNGADMLKDAANDLSQQEIMDALLIAQEDCFAVGLTTVSDAGLSQEVVQAIIALNESKELNMRMYAMLNPNEENKKFVIENGIYQTDYLHICSIKLYADGALGSGGACLCHPYTDDSSSSGFILHDNKYFTSYCQFAYDHNYQVCTHAIGDSANRFVLDLYAEYLKGKNDLRWRIEHAQVISENDFQKFADFSIIPSVQPTHATSDMGWAEKRLGSERVKNAYAYKRLLDITGWIPNGSDFPVESINPLFGFYSTIARKDQQGNPPNGFQFENALSREEALKAMTIWAAKSNFEENIKGSIELGKLADFVILENDIMEIDELEIIDTKVLSTYIGGKEVYKLNNSY
ncbi:MAG: amidohydrolase [Cytophagia bacterium]|nr:amidohydrolase [Cytophagia bacterium]